MRAKHDSAGISRNAWSKRAHRVRTGYTSHVSCQCCRVLLADNHARRTGPGTGGVEEERNPLSIRSRPHLFVFDPSGDLAGQARPREPTQLLSTLEPEPKIRRKSEEQGSRNDHVIPWSGATALLHEAKNTFHCLHQAASDTKQERGKLFGTLIAALVCPSVRASGSPRTCASRSALVPEALRR
jgi:hypothetical protein